MASNLLKYDISFEICTSEFKPYDFNSITFFVKFPQPNVQNPPVFDHHAFPEMAKKTNSKYLKSLRRKFGRFLSCYKALEANESTAGIGDDRCRVPNKFGFHSRTSTIDREERVREAIMYCKSTITSDSSWHEARSH